MTHMHLVFDDYLCLSTEKRLHLNLLPISFGIVKALTSTYTPNGEVGEGCLFSSPERSSGSAIALPPESASVLASALAKCLSFYVKDFI